MNDLRKLVFVLLLLIFCGRASAAAATPAGLEEVLIFLIDRSGSMRLLPEPDTTQAAVTEAIHVANLSGRPVKMAVILFNGNGVKILGDEKDLPTAALRALHKRVLNEWESPAGGTPLDAALQHCVRMVKELPASARVTVVNVGDGQPDSDCLRPDDFAEIREEMDRQIKALQSQAFPPRIIQELLEQRQRAWKSPATEEFKKLHDLQVKAEFQACLRHAAMLKGRKVRFVSLDFVGQLEALRKIHDAAGGVDADYATVKPANTVVKHIHGLGLTQLEGIVVPAPVQVAADANAFELKRSHPLDSVGDGAIVTIVFHQPIPRFSEQVELSADIGGATVTFDVRNNDPNVILSFDAAGNVVAATLVLPSLPANRDLKIRYRSPAMSLPVPEMTIFTHLRVAPTLRIEARPLHRGPEERAPFSVSIARAVEWTMGLRFQDDPKFLPLRGVEPVWRRRTDGGEIRVDMQPDPGTPGAFRSATPLQFPPGSYDLQVNLILESGAQIRLKVPLHVQAQQGDEHVTIQYDNTSQSDDHLELGEIGDEFREGTATLMLRTAGIDGPTQLELRIVGLADQQGNSPQEAWIQPAQKQLQAFPGRVQKAILRWKLPDQIEDGLVDGRYTGQLQIRRVDTDQVLDARPFDPALNVGTHSIADVSFLLRRPHLVARAPRAWRDRLQADANGHLTLPLNVDVGVPFECAVKFHLLNQSSLTRDVTSLLQTPFRDEKGRNIRGITMTLAEECGATQAAPAHGTVTFAYRLLVEDTEDLRNGTARLSFSSPGVHGVQFPVDVRIRQPLLGTWIRRCLYLLALLLLPLLILALRALAKANPYRAERALVCTSRKPSALFQLEKAAKDTVRINASGPISIRRQDEPHDRPVSGTLRLSAGDASPSNPLLIAEQRPDGQRTIIAVTEILFDEEGEPELQGYVVEGGRFEHRAVSAKRWACRHALAASLLMAGGLFLFHRPVLAAAQWVCDFLPR